MRTAIKVLLLNLCFFGCGQKVESDTYSEGGNLVSAGAIVAKPIPMGATMGLDRSAWRFFSAERSEETPVSLRMSTEELMRAPSVTQSGAFMTFIEGLEPPNEFRCQTSAMRRRGSGRPQLTAPSLIEFSQIEISGPVTVIAEYSPTEAVVIYADDNLIQLIESESRNDVLRIAAPAHDICYGIQPRVYLRGPQFSSIALRDQSNLEVYQLYARGLEIDAEGGSRVEVIGKANRVQLRVARYSSAELSGLAVDNLDIELGEHSDAEVMVTKSILGSINQGSRLRLNSTVQNEELTGEGLVEYTEVVDQEPGPAGLEPGVN